MFRRDARAMRSVAAVSVCVVILCAMLSSFEMRSSTPALFDVNADDDSMDAALARAASDALGEREGAIIVLDPQTGRVRAVVNPHIAFEQAFPPGSTIKAFTMLTALRAGLIDENSSMTCRTRYVREDYEITCAHAPDLAPLDPLHALAYSCNYYFGKLGERLNEGAFDTTLASFGFGARTGVDDEQESAGRIERGLWQPQSALGEGTHLLATPIQLLTAYAALFNGGHLYAPRRAVSDHFIKQERARIQLTPAHRALILEGMRGAVEYGTAQSAGLAGLPCYVFGKTGTATEIKGFRTDGWFVGFAAEVDQQAQASDEQAQASDEQTQASDEQAKASPSSVKLAVLVFLKRAHGAQAAELARPIFEAYAREHEKKARSRDEILRQGHAEASSDESVKQLDAPPASLNSSQTFIGTLSNSAAQVRVHLFKEDATVSVSLEEYILGVVATEGSVENELEALKALAVASRTYALKQRGRHARDGYDFCNTTHCQRFTFNADGADIRELVRRAVSETAGETLRDERGRVAETYFSASCGGMTANLETLWGVRAPPHLRGVRDDYCATMPHSRWTDVIPATQLASALRSDARSDVGARLDAVEIMRRDTTGRAQTIRLAGEHRKTLRGWDFKIIVGRALGWNILKSSRFEVERVGESFVFRGSGFGHGLGLCQEGAHVMAERGASYRQILNHYFPGTSVGNDAR